jgi:hypothetical protein
MTRTSGNTVNKPTLEKALGNLPKKFRSRIIKEYQDIKKRYSEALFDDEFDVPGLSTGKLVETILRFLQYHLTGSFIPFGTHIANFPDECRKLIILPKAPDQESLRIIIPRCLAFTYTLRGKRGIGHVGGDVEANSIDAATIVRLCDWIICELIRIFHNLSLEEAQDIVNALSTRILPDIWEVAGKKRVLRTDLNAKQKSLLLAYTDVQSGLLVEDLFLWVEYSNLAVFKRKVLKPLHEAKLIEYDKESEAVFLSPLGVQEVESKILKQGIK